MPNQAESSGLFAHSDRFFRELENNNVEAMREELPSINRALGFDPLCLHSAVQGNHPEALLFLLENNFHAGVHELKLLKVSASRNYINILNILLNHYSPKSTFINEALICAAEGNSVESFKLLLDSYNGNLNYHKGEALLIATTNHHLEIIKLIAEHSSTTATRLELKSTVTFLLKNNEKETALTLLEYGIALYEVPILPFSWVMEFLGYPSEMTPLEYMNKAEFDPKYSPVCLQSLT